MNVILEFKGQYRFLSNFWPVAFVWGGFTWGSAEVAYQAAKNADARDWSRFQAMSSAEAKRAGRKVRLRDDWEEIKFTVMMQICLAKFRQNPHLAEALRNTGYAKLEEGNTWDDRTWGVCPPGSGDGHNMLGLALMAVRAAL